MIKIFSLLLILILLFINNGTAQTKNLLSMPTTKDAIFLKVEIEASFPGGGCGLE